jgi:hypothetical protein
VGNRHLSRIKRLEQRYKVDAGSMVIAVVRRGESHADAIRRASEGHKRVGFVFVIDIENSLPSIDEQIAQEEAKINDLKRRQVKKAASA